MRLYFSALSAVLYNALKFIARCTANKIKLKEKYGLLANDILDERSANEVLCISVPF